MIKIAIIIGSTRPNRIGEGVAKWIYQESIKNREADFELVDLKDYNLPLLDEPIPAGMSHNYTQEHTKKWSKKISSFDAYIFVTPEYNHGTSAALKNALDFLYEEWNNKAAGIVSYGSVGGVRAAEVLRQSLSELQIATIRTQMSFNLRTDFENFKIFKPATYHSKVFQTFLEQLMTWSKSLSDLRNGKQDFRNKLDEERRSPSIH
ncbi:MAG: NADPH-dependent FMN reductase [Bacteriovoracaceae bacterium]